MTQPSNPDRGLPPSGPAFGRFRLLQLLGKSARTLVWLAFDPAAQTERLLVMPRAQAPDARALEQQLQAARMAQRITHPALAAALEAGEVERWPYVIYERGERRTLTEKAGASGLPAQDAARAGVQLLEGLAFAHDAGLSHRDLQPAMVLLDESGGACLIGLAIGRPADAKTEGEAAFGALGLQTQRRDAERDVLALGIVLHYALTGQYPLDRDDTGAVIAAMPPHGREIVRLPWSTARPIPEPLRIIANRATDRQPRQRYHNARTFARALEGWYRADAQAEGGPLALLLDRLHQIGALPSLPGASRLAARLALMERERTNELAEIVLQDPALTFELLRLVNTAQVRGAMVGGSGPVLTIRRAIALLGMDGVRRAALALRDWPGPLAEAQATPLLQAIERAQHAARVAQLLRPPGFDAEVVYLIALLQNLGRLLVHYHFPEEAAQLQRLVHPVPTDDPQRPEEPGMTEEAASYAVLGVDIEVLAHAVGRHWGLDDAVMHMIRRCSPGSPVHTPETDDETLRVTASCANEVVDAVTLQPRQAATTLQRVAQRYARSLGLGVRELQLAAQGQSPHSDGAAALPGPSMGTRHAA